MDENPRLKAKGARWFHTQDHKTVSLSKASLGKFFYEVLKVGAQVGEIWAFNNDFDRSPVYVSVFMTEQMKIVLEENLGGKVLFKDPPKVHLS